MAKNPPAMHETQVQSLGQEDPLEEEMATHSSIFCLENPMDRGAWWATVCGVAKSWTQLSDCTGTHIKLVQFSHSVMSDSLAPHGLQHTRPPCPSPIPRVDSNSFPLSRSCHPTISSSVVPFSSHLQSFPASGSSPSSELMSQLFSSGGHILEFQLHPQSFQ